MKRYTFPKVYVQIIWNLVLIIFLLFDISFILITLVLKLGLVVRICILMLIVF